MAHDAVTVDWRVRERRSRRRRSGWQTSGGVVVDVETGRVLLVRSRRDGWTWPKGLIDPGEGPVYAAIREIVEESGVLAEPVAHIGVIETKRALRHYYLFTKIREGLARASGRETTAVRWVDVDKAKELLDRKRDRRVLRAAAALLQGRNLATKPTRSAPLLSNPLPKSTLFSK